MILWEKIRDITLVLHHFLQTVICLTLALGFIVCAPLKSYADVTPIEFVIDFMVNAIENFGEKATNKIEGMTGDEFYDWWSDRTDFDSNGVKALMYAAATHLTPYGAQINGAQLENIGLMNGAKLNVAKVKQDWLDDIAALVSTGGIVDNIDANEYGLTTSSPVQSITLPVYGTPMRTYEGTSNFQSYGCYVSPKGLSSDTVYVCHCSGMPPMLKVGNSATLYHYGIQLPSGLYMVIDGETLLPAPYETYSDLEGWISSACCLTYRITPNTIYENGTWYRISGFAQKNSNNELYSFRRAGSAVSEIIVRGVSTSYDNPTDILSDYHNAALRVGAIMELDGQAPYITPPSNIPYDNNGDVYMIYNTYTGDTVYMSTDDYDTYVNNGTIVEGDYNQTLNDTTINNITNLLNPDTDTDTDNSSGGNVNLSLIEGLLRDIKSLLIQIKEKINIDDKITILDGTFGSEPVYEEFSDCITDNVPLVADVVDVVEALSTDSEDNGITEIGTHTAPSGAVGVQSVYDGFTINLSWYAPYRNRIRDVFRIIFYGFGLICCFSYVKSCFGVASGGGSSSDV